MDVFNGLDDRGGSNSRKDPGSHKGNGYCGYAQGLAELSGLGCGPTGCAHPPRLSGRYMGTSGAQMPMQKEHEQVKGKLPRVTAMLTAPRLRDIVVLFDGDRAKICDGGGSKVALPAQG